MRIELFAPRLLLQRVLVHPHLPCRQGPVVDLPQPGIWLSLPVCGEEAMQARLLANDLAPHTVLLTRMMFLILQIPILQRDAPCRI